MTLSPLAGKPAPAELLIDVDKLVNEYYTRLPDTSNPQQLVHFGTSGHRGTPEEGTFTKAHIQAISQAICDYRAGKRIRGPLFMGKDTHAVSGPAERAALEVLAANGVETMVQSDDGFTPTPVVSHAILCYNRGRKEGLADGIVITPSHNPPRDGGFKYNPPHGGPADTHVTHWIEERANSLLRAGTREIKRVSYDSAYKAATTHPYDFMMPYVRDLASVIDIDWAEPACNTGSRSRIFTDSISRW
jgi:phosphoglucomutase